jgi:hypothetical protein
MGWVWVGDLSFLEENRASQEQEEYMGVTMLD